jgi:hypothetical protein
MPYVIDNPKPQKYFFLTMILGMIGYGGLIFLILERQPTLGPRWLFFFFAMFAGTGTALPVVAYLNYFFPAKAPATQKIILRQATWFGMYLCVILWLAVGRVLSIQLATVIFVGMLIFEFVLRLREIAAWKD